MQRSFLVGALSLTLGASTLMPGAAHAQGAMTYLDDEAEAGGYDVTAIVQKTPVEMVLAEQENGDGYRLKIAADSIALSERIGKKVVPLAQARVKILPGELVAQRRGPRWRFITGKRIVLEAVDNRWREGRIGFRGGLKDARVQPVEDIFFDDDFMRVKEDVALAASIPNPKNGWRIADLKIDEKLWQAVAGGWSATGLSENDQAQVSQSANAFAFKSTAAGSCFAVSGRPFWNDYIFEASVKPHGAASIGLAAYWQDPKNYLALSWPEKGPLQLRAVVNGETRVLDAAAGQYETEQWYRLRLVLAGRTVRAFIDDQEVLRAQTGLFGRGQIGVWAENPTANDYAVFDDVSVRSLRDVHDDFSSPVPGRWQTVAGRWAWQNAAKPAVPQGSMAVTGEGDWGDYVAAASIALPADGAAGLLLHHQAGKGAYIFRLAGSKAKLPYAGKAQIAKIAGNKTTVLAEEKTGNRYDGKATMWNFSDAHGYLKATAGGTRVIDAFDESLRHGRAGLFAQRGPKGVPALRSFSIEFPRHHSTWAKVPELYEQEMQAQTMGGWSTPEGFWVGANPIASAPPIPAAKDEKTLWHKGAFWGDGSIQFAIPALDGGKKVILILENSGGSRGQSLKLQMQAEGNVLKTTLSPLDEKTGKAQTVETKLEKAPTGQIVRIMRRGTYTIVRLGDPANEESQKTLMAARM